MNQQGEGEALSIARLLQDPRVRAGIDVPNNNGSTALHIACQWGSDPAAERHFFIIQCLLRANANPTLNNDRGDTPMASYRGRRSAHPATIALLEAALENAEKSALVVKARRLVVAAASGTVAPSCLQARVAKCQPLPCVMLAPFDDDEE